MYRKYDLAKTIYQMPVNLQHECLSQEVEKSPCMLADLEAGILDKEWATNDYDHPVVKASSTPVLPIALYVDGVPFIKQDSMTCFFVYSLVTHRRHLTATLRKSELCKCGCKAWCSLYPIFELLRWSFAGRPKLAIQRTTLRNMLEIEKDSLQGALWLVAYLWLLRVPSEVFLCTAHLGVSRR